MRRQTPRSLVRASDLNGELATIRANGYAIDDEEFMPGLRCVAAVVYNNQAEALCAISVSGLSARLTSERVAGIGHLVNETARELTIALGGRLPDAALP
jgi:IclR family acetate operon transcriptional repressor